MKKARASPVEWGIPALTSDFPMGLPLSSKYRGTEWARRMKLFGAAMQGAGSALYVDDDDAHRDRQRVADLIVRE